MRRTSPWKMHTTPTSRGNAGKVGRRPPSTMDQLRDAWSTICREEHVETVVDVNRASIRQRRRPSCLDLLRNRSHTRFTRTSGGKLLQRIPLTMYTQCISIRRISSESRERKISKYLQVRESFYTRPILPKFETREALSASVLTSV